MEPRNEIADLTFAIARMEEMAQNAEDRENYSKASKFREKAREMNVQLQAMLAKRAQDGQG